MPSEPRPLEQGWLFYDRFEVKRVLGRGGFGIAYLATDNLRGDLVVVKELAPHGIQRLPNGVLRFDESSGQRLREQFLEEAGVLSRLSIDGIPPIRATFRENGTAYFATDYILHTVTLQDALMKEGRMDPDRALSIFEHLLRILDEIHARRILHRDIKPSNILLDEEDSVYLIDFGAAREWHADSTTTHTVLYTPGYAPPEQLSERARRGPATDLYALCATFFMMVVGVPPPSAAERASGIPLPSLTVARPDMSPWAAVAIEKGLSLAYTDRPQTVVELRDLLTSKPDYRSQESLTELDETLVRLRGFSYEKRSCPACNGLLAEPRPLKRGACPVCRTGNIRKRDIQERLCPVCHSGVLAPVKNQNPLVSCPSCRLGTLSYRRRSVISLDQVATCDGCQARYEVRSGAMTAMEEGAQPQDMEYWRAQAGRASLFWKCPDCAAQFDALPDGRWQQMSPPARSGYRTLFPEEWARVAIGLEPGAGNAHCDSCEADYYVEKEKLTLLSTKEDPFSFAETYLGRLLTQEHARWLGAGKSSPHPGVVCEECHTEFDRDQQYLRLVATSNRRLTKHVDQPKLMEDWHRIAARLPTIHEETEFVERVSSAIREGYRKGSLSFDNEATLLWRGEATRLEDHKSSTLSITVDAITFGGLWSKQRLPLDAIVGVWCDDDELHLQFSGDRSPIVYRLNSVELVAHLKSGDQGVVLTSRDLGARLHTQLGL